MLRRHFGRRRCLEHIWCWCLSASSLERRRLVSSSGSNGDAKDCTAAHIATQSSSDNACHGSSQARNARRAKCGCACGTFPATCYSQAPPICNANEKSSSLIAPCTSARCTSSLHRFECAMSQSSTRLMLVWFLHEMLYTATSSLGSSCRAFTSSCVYVANTLHSTKSGLTAYCMQLHCRSCII